VPVIEEHVLPADDEQEAAVPVAPRAGDSGGSPDARANEQPIDPAVAPPATPATPASPQPAEPEPTVASTSPAPTTPTAETAEPAPAAEPAPPTPAVTDPAPPTGPGGVPPRPPPATDPAPPAKTAPVDPVAADLPRAADPAGTDPAPVDGPRTDPPRGSEPIGVGGDWTGARQAPRVVDPLPAIGPPPADVRPDEGLRRSNERVDAGRCSRHACYGRGHYYGGGKARHRDARAKAVAALMEHARPAHPRRPG